MRERLTTLALFALVATVYYAVTAGITTSNDGSHYALTRALVDEQRLQIDSFLDFTQRIDLSFKDGHYYTDRPPGTALISVPFYLLADALPQPLADFGSYHDRGNPHLITLLMLPALAGAGAVAILFRMLRGANLSMFVSVTASLAFAFGTTAFRYGSLLFSHSLSAFLILATTHLSIGILRAGRISWKAGLLAGLALGASILVEYNNAIFAALIGIALAAFLRGKLVAEGGWRGLGAIALGGAIPVAALLWYNTAAFGGPFTTSYAYKLGFPLAKSVATTFSLPIGVGLVELLWTGRTPDDPLTNQGIILLMPVTLIGLGGAGQFFRQNWREALIVVGIFIFHLLLFSMHYSPSGGTGDGRYLNPYLGLWFLPVGFALDAIHRMETDSVARTGLLFLCYGLLFLSARNMLAHIGFSYGYNLAVEPLPRRAAGLRIWQAVIAEVFRNWQNVPLIWLVMGAGAGLIFGAEQVWKRANALTEAKAIPMPDDN